MAVPRPKISDGPLDSDLNLIGRMFADVFARYTVNVLSMCREQGLSLAEVLERQGEPEVDPAAVPDWVRAQHSAAVAEEIDFEAPAEVASRISRNKVVAAMWQKGWTQAELARRVDMSPTSISRILKDPDRSKVETLRKLAVALDVDLSELL